MKQRFETMHPGVCLLYFMAVLGCTMVCRHPIYLTISFCCAAGYTILLRGKVGIRFFIGVVLPVCLLSVVLNGWFNHYGVTPLFRLPGGNRVTLEALCQGAVLGGMFGAATLWLYCFGIVLPQDKLLYLGSQCMPALSLVLTMALRFVPTYTAQTAKIIRARQGMLGKSREQKFRQKMRHGGTVLSILTTWALENSIQTADSMRARGYGAAKRSSYRQYRWHAKDIICALCTLLIVGMLVGLAITGAWNVQYDPVIRFPEAMPIRYAGYVIYTVLCAMPLYMDIRGAWKWQRYLSKI